LLLNFLTALSAVFGCILGVAIAAIGDSAGRWLLAFTAGNFFYISLADMVQTLHSNRKHRLFAIETKTLLFFS
jgi:zinc transporter ZupT